MTQALVRALEFPAQGVRISDVTAIPRPKVTAAQVDSGTPRLPKGNFELRKRMHTGHLLSDVLQ